ncbi:MAG: glycosyltransferase family 2 protein [Candidatus Gastranaerophilales bacterium]|nr:glycosyltransferase family 2 protein [Candidatus Gastranaerophilales bacterium]
MKDRFTLVLLFVSLWVFLVIFQKLIPIESNLVILFSFMVAYTLYTNAAFKHQRRKYKKNPPKLDTSYKPFVSILIPGHNEELVFVDTVQNILNLDYANYEIILIDDRSTDNTADVIKQLEKNYPDKIRAVIREMSAFPGKSAVLNDVLLMSKGDVICVFDADARIKPGFLNKLLPYLAPEDVGAVQARKIINNKHINFLTRCQNNEYSLDCHFQLGRDSIKGAVELRGNGQLIKKEALLDVNGWNNYSVTDDLDLSTKLHLKRWDVRYCIDAEVYEEGVTRFIPLLKQRRRWVEGSIRRYLDYFMDVLFSKDISLRVSFDMWAYIVEFVLPIWLFLEWSIQSFKFIKGYEHNILSSSIVLVGLCLFFLSGLVYSLRKYDNLSLVQAIKQSIETCFYLVIVWTPLVTIIALKILFMKRTMDWGKTSHGLEVEKQLETA